MAQLRQGDVRAACALADQRAQLFAGTLRANLTLGRPDASDDAIADALRAAQLDRFVASLPAGLDTPVGDDGVALSGGERRRLAVARALLAPGPVLAARRADQRARRRTGRRRPRRRAGRGGARRSQRAGHHPPGRRGGALRAHGDARGRPHWCPTAGKIRLRNGAAAPGEDACRQNAKPDRRIVVWSLTQRATQNGRPTPKNGNGDGTLSMSFRPPFWRTGVAPPTQ